MALSPQKLMSLLLMLPMLPLLQSMLLTSENSEASQTYGNGVHLETLPTSTSPSAEALPVALALPDVESLPAVEAVPASTSSLQLEDVKDAVTVLVEHTLPLTMLPARTALQGEGCLEGTLGGEGMTHASLRFPEVVEAIDKIAFTQPNGYINATKTKGLFYLHPKKSKELTEFTIFGDSSFAPSGNISFRIYRSSILWKCQTFDSLAIRRGGTNLGVITQASS